MKWTPQQLEEILGRQAKSAKTHKYGAQKTTIDGQTFDSKGEADRFQVLKLLERAGQIKGLVRNPVFEIIINDVRICKYVADFEYVENGRRVVEDFKGMRTRAYGLKKKLVKAIHGIEILETGRK